MRNVLDEMQENNLLKIHESSFWVTFFVLIFVIVVQFVMGASFKEILGELIVLFFLGSTVIVKCLKSGIWMSEYEPSHKMNFLISAIVSVVIALFSQMRVRKLDGVILHNNILQIIILILTIFIVCFLILTLTTWIYFRIYTRKENEDV